MQTSDARREPLLGGHPVEGGGGAAPHASRLRLAAAAVAAATVAALLLLLLRPAHFIGATWGTDVDGLADWAVDKKPIVRGDPPFCRKSASIAVLPGVDANLQLLVWSGIGLHKSMFDDLHRLDMALLTWTAENASSSEHPWGGRWKAGNAQAVSGGMVVVGGDAYLPGTLKHRYENSVWKLRYPSLEWQQAEIDPSSPQPARRRGHSTMHYVDAQGADHIVIFGGRTKNGELLNDAWDVALRWPTAVWRCLTAQQPGAEGAPSARRGHSAVLASEPGAAEPQMLVYGGREGEMYDDDLWLLNVASGEWRRIEPVGRAPLGRDHHSAAFFNGSMFVFAGRSGAHYEGSRPLNSLWRFHLAARTWTQHQQTKDAKGKPLARFEHSYAQVTPPGSSDSRLVIFGGQTTAAATHREKKWPCQLNDVWSLSLTTLTWRELTPPKWCSKRCAHHHGRREEDTP